MPTYNTAVTAPSLVKTAQSVVIAAAAVAAARPTTGQLLPRSSGGGEQGPVGPTGPTGPAGQAAGRIYYLASSDASDISGYKTLLESPSAGAEQTIATVCTGVNVDFLVATFATDPGVPGAVDYPAGTGYRRLYAMVSSGTARFHLMVYKRNAAGVETLIRDEYSPNFTDSVVAMQEWTASAAAAGAMLATDRIVIKLYAQRISGGGGGSITVTTYYEGTSHTSQIQTTISVGAQGPKGDPATTLASALVALAPNVLTVFRTSGTAVDQPNDGSSGGFVCHSTGSPRVRQRGPATAGDIYAAVVTSAGAGVGYYDDFDFLARQAFTVVVFLRPTQSYSMPVQNERIIVKEGQWGMFLQNATGKLVVSRSAAAVPSPMEVAFGQWNMCAITYDGSNLGAYLNGTLVTDTDSGSLPDSSNVVYVGREGTGSSAYGIQTGSALGPVAMWIGRCLTYAELDSIYDSMP